METKNVLCYADEKVKLGRIIPLISLISKVTIKERPIDKITYDTIIQSEHITHLIGDGAYVDIIEHYLEYNVESISSNAANEIVITIVKE